MGRLPLFQRRDESSFSLVVSEKGWQLSLRRRGDSSLSLAEVRAPSSLPPISQRRGGWPAPSLSEKESLSEKGWFLLFRTCRIGPSRPSPLLPFTKRGGGTPLFSRWLAFPLSFREGVTALFQRRDEGVGRLHPLFPRRDDYSSFSRVEVRGPSSPPPFLAEEGWLSFTPLIPKRSDSSLSEKV